MFTGVLLLGFLGVSLSNSLTMSTMQSIAKDMLERDKDPYRFGRNPHILHPVVDTSDSSNSNCSEEE